MLEQLLDPQVWITLITLSAIEIVLGIDNLVFISIAVSKLPHSQRERMWFGIFLTVRFGQRSVLPRNAEHSTSSERSGPTSSLNCWSCSTPSVWVVT